jgi:hypothetical protein
MDCEDSGDDVRRNRLGEHLPPDEHHLRIEVVAARPRACRLDTAETQTVLERDRIRLL